MDTLKPITHLPHRPPVLHVPAVLSEPLRVRLPGVCPYQPGQQIAALELEVESLVSEVLEREVRRASEVRTYSDLRELFGERPVPVPETGEVGAVDPLALSSVVQVRPHLRPDGLVQLHRVPGQLGLLGQLQEQSPALQAEETTLEIL